MTKINWTFTQNNSDKILSDGLFKLKTRPYQLFSDIEHNGFGNYLISHNKTNYYVGEGKELSKRLKQQFKPTTSTFYKNLIKLQKTSKAISNIAIDAFKVQALTTLGTIAESPPKKKPPLKAVTGGFLLLFFDRGFAEYHYLKQNKQTCYKK